MSVPLFERARDFPLALTALSTRWRYGLAFVCGALSVLALAPFFLWPVLFLTLPVLVWLIDASASDDRRMFAWRAAVCVWWFAFGYFVFGLFWIGEAFLVEAEKFAWALPFAVTLLPAGLALFWACAAAAASLVWGQGFYRVLVLAVALSAAEWLRGHVLTGFPWNVLGYGLTAPDTFMQSAGLFGIYGLTLLAVIVFAGPLVVACDAKGNVWRRASGLALSLVILSGLCVYGQSRIGSAVHETVPNVKFRLVQPSVLQREKWQPDKQREIFTLHLALSKRNQAGVEDGLAGITHVVWPEAAMPFLPLEHPEALNAISDLLPPGVQLITGALRLDATAPGATPLPRASRRAYNTIMVFGDDGHLASVYDKIHLVPFGEYLPLNSILSALGLEKLAKGPGSFASGVTPRPLLDIPGLPPAIPLICYEALFPEAIAPEAKGPRPGLILNVTNDGWFGNTTGPQQHFHQARVRAVEHGLPLVRVANNGVSAMVGPLGEIVARLGLDEIGVIEAALPKALDPPPYGRFGDRIFLIILIGTAFIAMFAKRSAAKRK